jgi:PAS domain-containing protein
MENELSRVLDTLPALVWTALPDGHVYFFNQHRCEYTGLSVDEAYGPGWQTAIHPEDLPEVLERWRSILASGELSRGQHPPTCPGIRLLRRQRHRLAGHRPAGPSKRKQQCSDSVN